MLVNLEITDTVSGKKTIAFLSVRELQKLYKTIRTVLGDIQYGAKPMELITVPDIKIPLELGDRRQDGHT